MSFYNSEFFAGCESLMEDDTNLPAEDLPVEEAVVEQQEAADAAAEPVEAIAEQEEVAEATEQMFAKFDEIDRMIAYVGQYGVDKSFLSLCNHDDILNQAFNLGLPATESFEEAGDPNSAVSQAAMEGLKEAAKSVWDWIKKVVARIRDFFRNTWAKIKGWFGKNADTAEKASAEAAQIDVVPENEKSEDQKAAGEKTVAAPAAINDTVKKLAAEAAKEDGTGKKEDGTGKIAIDKQLVDALLEKSLVKGSTLSKADMGNLNANAKLLNQFTKSGGILDKRAAKIQKEIDEINAELVKAENLHEALQDRTNKSAEDIEKLNQNAEKLGQLKDKVKELSAKRAHVLDLIASGIKLSQAITRTSKTYSKTNKKAKKAKKAA